MFAEQNFQEFSIQCSGCGQTFQFTVEEQEFYHQKGFTQPKKCAHCRAQNRKNRSGGGGRFGGGGFKKRFDAVCDQCGVQTTVPFEPVQDKAVYCSDCYRSMKNS